MFESESYDQKKHRELLQRSRDLEKQGKDLSLEDEDEYLKLCVYDVLIEDQIFWQDRYLVFSLMKDFLDGKINSENFCSGVYGLRRKLIEGCDKFTSDLLLDSENVKDFQLDHRANRLRGFITDLFFRCENFLNSDEPDESYFRNSLMGGFVKFQKVLE